MNVRRWPATISLAGAKVIDAGHDGSVEVNSARPTRCLPAKVLGAQEPHMVAQHPEQRHLRFHVHVMRFAIRVELIGQRNGSNRNTRLHARGNHLRLEFGGMLAIASRNRRGNCCGVHMSTKKFVDTLLTDSAPPPQQGGMVAPYACSAQLVARQEYPGRTVRRDCPGDAVICAAFRVEVAPRQ